jgi:hypothetical protein
MINVHLYIITNNWIIFCVYKIVESERNKTSCEYKIEQAPGVDVSGSRWPLWCSMYKTKPTSGDKMHLKTVLKLWGLILRKAQTRATTPHSRYVIDDNVTRVVNGNETVNDQYLYNGAEYTHRYRNMSTCDFFLFFFICLDHSWNPCAARVSYSRTAPLGHSLNCRL